MSKSDEASKQSFFSLNPMRILDAVEQLGVRCTGRCMSLNSLENRVHEIELENGDYVVSKFYRPGRWTEEQIREEHSFLKELQALELPVVAPLNFPDGETLASIDASSGNSHDEGQIFFAVFPRKAGRLLDEFSDDVLPRIGRLVARIHGVGAAEKFQYRPALSWEDFIDSSIQDLEGFDFLPQQFVQVLSQLCKQMETPARAALERQSLQRLHGDFHIGNLLHRGSDFLVVDFDDARMGPAVQDIWLLLPGRDAQSIRQREILIEGYEQLRDFDRSSLALTEVLRCMRMVHYLAWIAKRWEDPAFQNIFPRFELPEFWQEQVVAVQESVELFLCPDDQSFY